MNARAWSPFSSPIHRLRITGPLSLVFGRYCSSFMNTTAIPHRQDTRPPAVGVRIRALRDVRRRSVAHLSAPPQQKSRSRRRAGLPAQSPFSLIRQHRSRSQPPVRQRIHKRMLAYDGMTVHPDIGFYGNISNREWKQYALPDDDAMNRLVEVAHSTWVRTNNHYFGFCGCPFSRSTLSQY